MKRRRGRLVSLGCLVAVSVLAACEPPQSATSAPAASPAELPWQAATLTVGREPRQHFAGFGFSFELNNPYSQLSEERKAEVDQLLFKDLNARIVRLWYTTGDPTPLRDFYLKSGIIPHALANGVTELLLAPGSYLGSPEKQARAIASDIATMRDDYGIRITTTGVLNEPDDDRKRLRVSDYVPLTIGMRRELDARGLQNVKTIGPEFASADDGALKWFDTVAADPVALASFDALGTHSYNMAANPVLAQRVLVHHKQYWMTEAGGGNLNGSAEFDYAFAASVSSRFLNDLNNAVDHWIWFIGMSLRYAGCLSEAGDVRGSLRPEWPHLQELWLLSRAADHVGFSAGHRHAPCDQRSAAMEGPGLDLRSEAAGPNRGRRAPRRALGARSGGRHPGRRLAPALQLGPAHELPGHSRRTRTGRRATSPL